MFYQFPVLDDEFVFQEFCKDIFNEKYKVDDFQIYKTKGAAQFGIDVYSLSTGIVVQAKKKKLSRADKTIERELLNDIDNTIDLVKSLPFQFSKIIFATTTRKYSSIEDKIIKLNFTQDFEVSLICWDDFNLYINEFPFIRKKYFPNYYYDKDQYPKILTFIPKLDKSQVFGRDGEIKIIKDKIFWGKSPIIINGLGGIGKTTVAKLVLNNIFDSFDHVLWLDHIYTEEKRHDDRNLLADIYLNHSALISNLNLVIDNDREKSDWAEIISNRLCNISGKNFLIIDNCPRHLHPLIDKLFGNSNWTVILTSREIYDGIEMIELDSLTIDEAKLLFKHFYSLESNDELVEKIIAFIGYHTLTIELISKVANKRRFTLQYLLQTLAEFGIDIPKTALITTEHDWVKKPMRHFEYLLAIFSLAGLQSEQKQLLLNFSVLFSEYITYDDLKNLLKIGEHDNYFFDTLTSLVELGWLRQIDESYQMHQVISEVVRKKEEVTIHQTWKLYQSLFDRLNLDFDKDPFLIRRFVNHAEIFVESFTTITMELAGLYNLVGLRNEDYGNFKKATYYYHKAREFYESDEDRYHDGLATVLGNLQSVTKTIGKIDLAFEYQLRSIAILEKQEELDFFALASAFNNLSLLYSIQGDLTNSIKYMTHAVSITERSELVEHPYLASCYNNLSLMLHDTGEIKKAVYYQKKSFEMRLRLLDENHPQIDEGYNNMAAIYHSNGEIHKAEKLILQAIESREKKHGKDNYKLGASYNNLASIYLHQGKLHEAVDCQNNAIRVEILGLGENHHELSKSYSTLATIKSAQGKYQESIDIAEKAKSIAIHNFPQGHKDIDMLNIFIEMNSSKIPKITDNQQGRNEICNCGSNKKFKRCCG
ncbi:tetratricopeptide repeat protein [Pedobacter sp. D749]|uniref:tetratricopeptide repeat protein n=1 Tax=Pedobacter sp. D749 TaxID=2856523 RepID=UPI001C598AFF|nr:tetratricopeptide repeat protein [Pedobacter sp. D749]QXU41461.1 tetratricopeptide repeat protein [Pedobacter sp. D749]